MTVLKEFSAILAQRSKFNIQNSAFKILKKFWHNIKILKEFWDNIKNSEGILGQHSKVPPVSAGECDWENPGEMFSHKSLKI